MARQETTTINGQDYVMQSVTPRWYFETNDKCGMTGERKDTTRYMDIMFRNVIIDPPEVAQKGLKYFDEREDVETPELLIREIEKFLRPGAQPGSGGKKST
jgi:hypothetical protein